MKILGMQLPFTSRGQKELAAVADRGGWHSVIREAFAGAWQQNVEVHFDSALSNHAVFACQTLISSDVSKLRLKLVAYSDADQVWTEAKNPAYSPVLRKPNHFQNRIQFFENWMLSKLQRGNTYVLKQRDGRGVVVKLYILDPTRTTPLVSDSGEVFYELQSDNLVGIEQHVIVPAREIIHDRFNCFFHPLVGLSPIFANGLSSMQGLAIQNNSARFFANNSQPGGILTAPAFINSETAERLKQQWEQNYSGKNAGKVAVLGDGLKYESMAVNAVDAQLIEQLKWSAEVVCSTYHVPPYKIGVGAMPSYNNVQALNTEYYSQCLQAHLEHIELCLDEGLGIGEGVVVGGSVYGTEFDTDQLLRMDSVTQMDMLDKAKNLMKPDEARRRLNLPKVAGGDAVYRQQQDYSLEALAKRDAQADPFQTAPVAEPTPAVEPPANDNAEAEAQASKAIIEMMKGLA